MLCFAKFSRTTRPGGLRAAQLSLNKACQIPAAWVPCGIAQLDVDHNNPCVRVCVCVVVTAVVVGRAPLKATNKQTNKASTHTLSALQPAQVPPRLVEGGLSALHEASESGHTSRFSGEEVVLDAPPRS